MRPFFVKNRFLIGSIFVILGVSIWAYGYYNVDTIEDSLNGSLTQEERWLLAGSLQWWKITQVTTLNPLSVMLICLGVLLIVYWFIQLALPLRIERIRE
jgi:hypothetical protein